MDGRQEQINALEKKIENLLYMYGDSDKEMNIAKKVNGYRIANLKEKIEEIKKQKFVTVKIKVTYQNLSDIMEGDTKEKVDYQVIKGVRIIKEEEGHITIGYLQGREPITRRLPKDRIEIM